MKTYYLCIAIAVLGLAGCSGSGESYSFLPGIYICQAENEFCKIDDTLIIREQGITHAEYAVTRKSSFQRFKDGKALSPEYQEADWILGYDAPNKVLVSPGKTIELQYDASHNKIFKGDWEYEKVE